MSLAWGLYHDAGIAVTINSVAIVMGKISGAAAVSITCSFLICCGSLSRMTCAKDVFASSAHLKVLAEGEKSLMRTLHQYIDDEIQRLDQIDSLLTEVRTLHDSFAESPLATSVETGLTANPLHAFHLIKRFATTWRIIWATASNFTAYEALKEASDQLVDQLPLDSDVNSAMWSLVRLQKTYELPISDLMRGHMAGYYTSPLNPMTSFELAIMCLGNGEPNDAIKWLTHAHEQAHNGEEDGAKELRGSLSLIYQAFGRAYAQKEDYKMAVEYIRKAIALDPTNRGFLIDILPPPSDNPIVIQAEEPEWRRNYFELCRKAAYSDSYIPQTSDLGSRDSQLYCHLQRSRLVPFTHHRVEYLHLSPDVVLFHDFVSNGEAKLLRDIATTKIVRAKVGASADSVESEARVGKIAWLYDDVDDVVVRRISRRVADVTGLNITFPTSEPLQMSNYGLGGHYEPHFDYDEYRFEREEQAPEIAEHGDRLATFMIYLNEVLVGGATAFTKLNLAAKPVKNAAIFWYNYKRSGHLDPLSLHAACPVLIGEKWVANKWIRERGQEFHRPCGLAQDSPSKHHVTTTSLDR